jgi:hypothetical protein
MNGRVPAQGEFVAGRTRLRPHGDHAIRSAGWVIDLDRHLDRLRGSAEDLNSSSIGTPPQ